MLEANCRCASGFLDIDKMGIDTTVTVTLRMCSTHVCKTFNRFCILYSAYCVLRVDTVCSILTSVVNYVPCTGDRVLLLLTVYGLLPHCLCTCALVHVQSRCSSR